MRVRLLDMYDPYFHTCCCCCCCCYGGGGGGTFLVDTSKQMMAHKFKQVLAVYGKKRTTGYVMLISTNFFL